MSSAKSEYFETSIRRVTQLGGWLGSLSSARFVLLVLSIEILRIGITWQREPVFGYQVWAQTWPSGSSWDSSPAWLLWSQLGLVNAPIWPLSWLLLVALALIAVAFLGHRYLNGWPSRMLVLSVLASGIPFRLVEGIGTYDVLFLLASILIAFPWKFIWISAALLGGLANAEVAAISGVCIVLAGLGFKDSFVIRKGIVFTLFGLMTGISVQIVGAITGKSEGGRVSVFAEAIVPSLIGNIPYMPLILATGYLGAWFAIFFVITSTPKVLRMLSLVAGLVILPIFMAMVTLDGTRVFVVTSAAAMVLSLQFWLNQVWLKGINRGRSDFLGSILMSAAFLIFVFAPETSVFTLNPQVFAPWQLLTDVLYEFRPYLLP